MKSFVDNPLFLWYDYQQTFNILYINNTAATGNQMPGKE